MKVLSVFVHIHISLPIFSQGKILRATIEIKSKTEFAMEETRRRPCSGLYESYVGLSSSSPFCPFGAGAVKGQTLLLPVLCWEPKYCISSCVHRQRSMCAYPHCPNVVSECCQKPPSTFEGRYLKVAIFKYVGVIELKTGN